MTTGAWALPTGARSLSGARGCHGARSSRCEDHRCPETWPRVPGTPGDRAALSHPHTRGTLAGPLPLQPGLQPQNRLPGGPPAHLAAKPPGAPSPASAVASPLVWSLGCSLCPHCPSPLLGGPPEAALLCLRSPGMTPCVSAGVELGLLALGHLACFREFPCFCVPLESTRLERSSRKLRPETPQLSAPQPRPDVFSFCISCAEIKKNHG